MTEKQSPDRFWSVVDVPKTLAGALAAVCAAVVGSYLGVAGTLIGAAVASVVATVGTEVYNRSFRRGAKRLQTLAPTFVRAPAAIGTPPVAAATIADSPAHTLPVDDHPGVDGSLPDKFGQNIGRASVGTPNAGTTDSGTANVETTSAGTTSAGTARAGTSNVGTTSAGTTSTGTIGAGTNGTVYTSNDENSVWRRVRWSRVAMVAGAVFLLAMGALTVTELITGKSVASSVGNSTKAHSTLDGLFNPGTGQPTPATSPSSSTKPPTAASSPAATPSTAPGSAAPSTTPSADATPSTVPPSPTTGAATTPPPAVGLNQIQRGQTSGVTGP